MDVEYETAVVLGSAPFIPGSWAPDSVRRPLAPESWVPGSWVPGSVMKLMSMFTLLRGAQLDSCPLWLLHQELNHVLASDLHVRVLF